MTLTRATAHNALDAALVAALRAALADAREPSVAVIVLAAEGPTWCAGADLAALAADAAPRGRVIHEYADLLADMVMSPAPIVAEVEGAVRGGGVGLLCAADLVAMGLGATVSLPEARVGLWPMMVGALLPRVVAPRVAMDLALTGRVLAATECLALGLASRVGARADIAADELVRAVQKGANGAIRAGRAAWRTVEDPGPESLRARLHCLADALDELARTPEAAARVASFLRG
ncbi:MAG: enoyl-CoA hydratase/isomerase family protein [Myxococcales bacterium]|nr:enoyl-CoA hydratase/isomerase family protein [Myxococcales bacterium]